MKFNPFTATGAGMPVRPEPEEPGPPRTEAERHVAWERAIEKMEMDLLVAKRLLSAIEPPDVDAWDAPEDIGPLPRHLLDRAERLLDEQRRVGAELVEALGLRRRQHAYAERVSQTVPSPGAAYLDIRS
ncbi:MAG TPA: hypothetical protein VGE77_08090 [Nocardioides sp.]